MQRSTNNSNAPSIESSRIAHSIGTALDRFIKNNQAQFQYASGELSQLLRDIALASKVVNREVNKAGLIDIMGAVGSQNMAGDEQQNWMSGGRRFTGISKGGEVCAPSSGNRIRCRPEQCGSNM
jgi:fructose-1,6-bisphosphatase I